MSYHIDDGAYNIARKMGLHICVATNPKYKIEIYDGDGIYLTQVGARGYKDYWQYLREEGNVVANKRRSAYAKRHHKEMEKKDSRGYLVGKILWKL
jgi:hypothetical protein